MGRFDTTKATINANIKKNGNQEITGSILNSVMTEMVDATDAELAKLSAEINGNAEFIVPTKAGVGLGLSQKFSIELVQGDASVLLIDDDGVLNVSYVNLYFYGDDQNNNIFSIGINKDIYKTFTLPQNTKSFAVYAAGNTIVKDGQIVLKFKDNDGLQKGIRDEIAILKENNESIVNEVESLSAEIGGVNQEYGGDALTESGYVDASGKITASTNYVHSPYVSVGVGTTITCTTNLAASISRVALYDKDKKWTRSLTSDKGYTTLSIVVEEGEAYMIMTSLVSQKNEYKVEVTGYGIKNDVANLMESQKDLEHFVADIEPILRPSVGEFYKDAWVRYSDGYIASSSGGAKLYRILRADHPNATKIVAEVSTEQTTFAAIAFYSTEIPSTSSYIKEASVQGASSNEAQVFEATIPSECRCIIVLNMSQYSAEYRIQLDESPFLTQKDGVELVNKLLPISNVFAEKDMYYHFNQENAPEYTYIPAQSLADIDFAARLGFNMIEANIHACSDGVFLCKHGSAGKFGNGIKSDDGVDYANVLISSISSEYARQHITYNSLRAKYNTPIPTLDEFAATCKKYNLAIKVEYADGVLPLLRKYFTDDKLFFTQMESRGDFKGLIEVIWNPTKNMTDFEKKCKDLGQPLQIIIQSGYWDELTTEQIEGIVSFSHERGYTLAVPYLLASQWVAAKAMGVDVNLSCYASIPSFSVGNRKNISSLKDAELIKEGGATYDAENDIITMPKGSAIKVKADSIVLGAVAVDMLYKGNITLVFSQSMGTRNITCASAVYDSFSYASAIYPASANTIYSNEYVTITANEDTILQSISIRCSEL